MKLLRKRVAPAWYFVLVIFIVITIFPIYWMFITSFKSFRDVYSIVPKFLPTRWMWQNYLQIFQEYNYGPALLNSMVISLLVACISVIVAIFTAYTVVRLRFRGSRLMPQTFLFAYLIPQTILFIPLYIFLSNIHLTDTIWGLVLIYPTMTIPYAVWVMITYFQGLSREMEEAAMVDGATRFQTILYVIIPPSLPTIISTFIFSFTICWSEYIYALIVISKSSERTITLALSNMLVADIIPWGPLMAGAMIAALPIMIVYMISSKYIVTGLTPGSAKG